MRRDPTTALHADIGSFAVAEGHAELSTVTTTPGDEVGIELLELLKPQLTEPAAKTAFLQRMVAERRLVIRIQVNRL